MQVVTFKNKKGDVVAEVIENSTSQQAEEFAQKWNEKANNEDSIVEIVLSNGIVVFLNNEKN